MKEPRTQVAAAAASVTPGMTQPQKSQLANPSEPESTSDKNQKGDNERVKQVIADVSAKLEKMQAKATTIANNSSVATKTPIATDGEVAATPEEQIEQLKLQKDQLMAKLKELDAALKDLNEQLPEVQDKLNKLNGEVEAQLKQIDAQLKTTNSPAGQKALRIEEDILKAVKPKLADDLNALKAKINQVKQAQNDVRVQLQAVNRASALAIRANEKLKEEKKNAKISEERTIGAVAAGQGVGRVAATGSRLGQRQQKETPKDKADEAAENDRQFAMAQGGGNSRMGGFSC